MSDDHDDDYVGHKHPPKRYQFKKGGERPPGSGRKKGTKNLKTIVAAEAGEMLPHHDGRRAGRISKLEALVKATMVRAIKGDQRATETIFKLVIDLLGGDASDLKAVFSTAEDRAMLAAFAKRQGGSHDG